MFDQITVQFKNKTILARPYKFEQDNNGNLIKAIEYITSCPHCGHMNTIETIYTDDIINIKCGNCGIGEFKDNKDNNVKSLEPGIIIDKSEELESLINSCAFIDPIELGVFTVDPV